MLNAEGLPHGSCYDLRSPLGAENPPALLHAQLPTDVGESSLAYSTEAGLQSFKYVKCTESSQHSMLASEFYQGSSLESLMSVRE